MTKDDVLFGYRQQLFAEAARTNVTEACRTFGVMSVLVISRVGDMEWWRKLRRRVGAGGGNWTTVADVDLRSFLTLYAGGTIDSFDAFRRSLILPIPADPVYPGTRLRPAVSSADGDRTYSAIEANGQLT